MEENEASFLLWLLPLAASRNQAGGVFDKIAVFFPKGSTLQGLINQPIWLIIICVILRFVSKEQVCYGCSNYGEIR